MTDLPSRTVILRYSLRTVGPYYPLLFVPLATLAYLGASWLWWALLVCLLLIPAGLTRLVLDDAGLTIESVLRLIPRQRFAWSELGPFERSSMYSHSWSPYGVLRARIHGANEFRYLWILSSDYVTISAVYGRSTFSRALRNNELLALLERSRIAASG